MQPLRLPCHPRLGRPARNPPFLCVRASVPLPGASSCGPALPLLPARERSVQLVLADPGGNSESGATLLEGPSERAGGSWLFTALRSSLGDPRGVLGTIPGSVRLRVAPGSSRATSPQSWQAARQADTSTLERQAQALGTGRREGENPEVQHCPGLSDTPRNEYTLIQIIFILLVPYLQTVHFHPCSFHSRSLLSLLKFSRDRGEGDLVLTKVVTAFSAPPTFLLPTPAPPPRPIPKAFSKAIATAEIFI